MEPAFFPWKKYLVYSLAALALIFAYSWITSPMLVTVVGSGEVFAKAETATVTFNLSSKGDSPQAASTAVKNQAATVKQNLAQTGIPESDIYESQISLIPSGAVVSGGTGFQASISMGLKTTHVDTLDSLATSLYAMGASLVTQPVLAVGNVADLEKQAYNLAIKDAKKKAGNIAFSNLKLLKKVVLIEQSATGGTSTVTTKADTASQVEKNISPETGLIKISKVVSVGYKMW